MKYFITACVLILTQYIFANQPYRTQMIANDIASLQVNVTGQDFSFPVIQLGSNQTIDISFDQLSYDVKSYYYKIIHCDAQWYPSAISEMDYLSGFSTGSIDDY